MSTLCLVPCTVKFARKWVREHHRHLELVQGGLFAVAAADETGMRAVAIAGVAARVWNGTGRLVISRVASDGVANGCSILYGAMCRAAKALGYREVWTYTLPEEGGVSLRAAGFTDMGLSAGGEHDRPSRARRPAKRPDKKRRWRRVL